jgi:hypothetical protein
LLHRRSYRCSLVANTFRYLEGFANSKHQIMSSSTSSPSSEGVAANPVIDLCASDDSTNTNENFMIFPAGSKVHHTVFKKNVTLQDAIWSHTKKVGVRFSCYPDDVKTNVKYLVKPLPEDANHKGMRTRNMLNPAQISYRELSDDSTPSYSESSTGTYSVASKTVVATGPPPPLQRRGHPLEIAIASDDNGVDRNPSPLSDTMISSPTGALPSELSPQSTPTSEPARFHWNHADDNVDDDDDDEIVPEASAATTQEDNEERHEEEKEPPKRRLPLVSWIY